MSRPPGAIPPGADSGRPIRSIESRYAPESSFREELKSDVGPTIINQIINEEPVESPILAKGIKKFTYLFVEL